MIGIIGKKLGMTQIFNDDDLRQSGRRPSEMARSVRPTALAAVELAPPHTCDLSTATSGNSSGEP